MGEKPKYKVKVDKVEEKNLFNDPTKLKLL